MADIVGSLFGASPQAVQAEMTAPIFNRAQQFAQLTPMQQAQYGIYSGGAMLGQGIGGLLGGEDPRLVQARQMQQVKEWIAQSGVDINTPEGLAQAAQYAQSIGATEGAMFLGQQAMAKRKSMAEVGTAEENLQRGQQYRAAIAELQKNPNATEQDYINLARQFATPEAGMNAAIAAQAKQDAAKLKAEADRLDFVTNSEGQPVGKFDKTGRFISTSGVVTPAKDYQAAKTQHEAMQDALDSMLEITDKDLKNAYGSLTDYTTLPMGAKLTSKDTYDAQIKINKTIIDGVLDNLSRLKGASSDKEMMAMKSNFPGYDADPSVMKNWLKRSIAMLNSRLQRGEQQFGFDTKLGNTDYLGGTKKEIVKTGKDSSGRKVVQYSDGSVEYAD